MFHFDFPGAIGGGRSKAADASRSVSRTIQNNFLDDKKQEVWNASVITDDHFRKSKSYEIIIADQIITLWFMDDVELAM